MKKVRSRLVVGKCNDWAKFVSNEILSRRDFDMID